MKTNNNKVMEDKMEKSFAKMKIKQENAIKENPLFYGPEEEHKVDMESLIRQIREEIVWKEEPLDHMHMDHSIDGSAPRSFSHDHKRVEGSNEDTFHCDFGALNSLQKRILERNINSKKNYRERNGKSPQHKEQCSDEMPLACNVSNKAFGHRHLNSHREIHLDKKLLACNVVNKAFKRKCNTNAHKFVPSKEQLRLIFDRVRSAQYQI